MTRVECEIIKNEILEQLMLEGKLVGDLVREPAPSETDLVELDGGRCATLKAIGKAIGVDLSDYISRFLSRLESDAAEGLITFISGFVSNALSKMLGGAEFGEFVAGMTTGRGGNVDSRGNAEVESIRVRSFMEVMELIYNRLNALEGRTSFADSGTLESVVGNPDGTLTAAVRKRWDGDFTAFQPGDVVYGYVNDLNNGSASVHYKAWAWIRSIDRAANTLTLSVYPDSEVPEGVNFPVAEHMVVSRWGNNVEPTAEAYENPDYRGSVIRKTADGYVNIRQSSFYISCDEGNLVELTGVSKPILEDGNYGTVLGQIPEGLLDEDTMRLVNSGQPYLYARGIIVQDLIRVGYRGVKVRTPNFRGLWDPDTASDETAYYRTADDIADVVALGGVLWQCVAAHASPVEPSDGNPEWLRLTSKPNEAWQIIPSVNTVYIRRDSYSTDTLECTVRHYGADGAVDYTTPEALDGLGVKLMFSLDGVDYREFWVRSGETVAGLELGDGSGSLDMGGNNVPWIEITDRVNLYVVDSDMNRLAQYVVPVVRDGSDGSDGEPGRDGKDGKDGRDGDSTEVRYTIMEGYDTVPALTKSDRRPVGWELTHPVPGAGQSLWRTEALIDCDDSLKGQGWSDPACLTGKPGPAGAAGRPGPLVYPAGVYDADTEYVSDERKRPYVADGVTAQGLTVYFLLKEGARYCGRLAPEGRKTPHEDYMFGDSSWEMFDSLRAVYAQILMADFAKLASAVFTGDLMFSQQGVDDNGDFSDSYRDIGAGFTPNLALDFLAGRLRCNDAEIRGHIEATSGTFSGTVRAANGYFSGVLRNTPTVITPGNYADYASPDQLTPFGSVLDWEKCGMAVRFEGDFFAAGENYLVVELPSDMEYLGNTFRVENESDIPVTVAGTLCQFPYRGEAPEVDERAFVYPGRGICLTCEVLPSPGARPGANPENPEDLRDTRLRLMWRYAGIYVTNLLG